MSGRLVDPVAVNQGLQDRLAPITDLLVFDASLTDPSGDETDPALDEHGRVRNYVVIYDSTTGMAPALDTQPTAAMAMAQLTCVGATAWQCRWVVREVRKAVVGKPSGPNGGTWHEPPGQRPPIALDRDARPARFYMPLQIEALVSAERT